MWWKPGYRFPWTLNKILFKVSNTPGLKPIAMVFFIASHRHAELVSASHQTYDLLGVHLVCEVLKQVQHDIILDESYITLASVYD